MTPTLRCASLFALALSVAAASSCGAPNKRHVYEMSPSAHAYPSTGGEEYDVIGENRETTPAEARFSTFSIDVDTASYANVRRFLRGGSLPPVDAVRAEELINYFSYDYPSPTGDEPFAVTTEVGPAPWRPERLLVQIGLRGVTIAQEAMPPRNLVFLLDVSGSMGDPNKLPLLVQAFKLLTRQLAERDRVAIVVYAGASGVVLEPTPGDQREAIMGALDQLGAGGSTNGGAGIELAYKLARENYRADGVNRVILATDGDFNVGVSDRAALLALIDGQRASGVALSVIGFGTGNLKDSTMEQLAAHGNGNYAYIDSYEEARKVLGEQAGSTLVTVASDVKIQVEFNPATVASYRLVGYENRVMANTDFTDDTKDAGEIGSGHTVTAFYEVVPVENGGGELMTVRLRFKRPGEAESTEIARPVAASASPAPSLDFRFAAAVASFAMLLRKSEHAGQASFAEVASLARSALGADPAGRRAEFLELVAIAQSLSSGKPLDLAK